MQTKRSTLCLSFRCWWVLFFLVNIILLSSMIASIFIKKWITFDLSSNTYEGGLLKGEDDDAYDDSAEDYCDLYDLYKEYNITTIAQENALNFFESMCEMTKNLYKGGVIYVGMECVSVLSLLIWFLSMIIYCRQGKGAICGYLFSCIAVLSHAMGIIIYILLTKLKFQDSCKNTFESDSYDACADIGPKFALGILGALFLISLLFIIVARQVQNAGGKEVLSANPDSKVGPTPEAARTNQNEVKIQKPTKNTFEPRGTYDTKQATMKANSFYMNSSSNSNRNMGNNFKPSPALKPREKFTSHPQFPGKN